VVCVKNLAVIEIDKGIEPAKVAIALRFLPDRRTFFFLYHGQRNKYQKRNPIGPRTV